MNSSLSVSVESSRAVARIRTSPLLWVLLLGLLLGFAFQGSRGLWSPDEGRYVGVALQMMDSGNYLAPAYSPASLNFSKPPLTYWVIAASLHLFGRNTWAARMPYALAYLATLALLFAMGKRTSPSKPWLPSLVYATSLFTFFSANIISTDVLLTLTEGLAVFGFILHTWPQGDGERRRGLIVMWLGFGLAFLTKGPPGLLPLLSVIAFAATCGGARAVVRLLHPAGLVIFLLVGFTWYAVVILRYPGLLHYFLHQEVYGRIFTAMHKRHAGAFGWAVAFLPVLVLGTIPWWRGLARSVRDMLKPATWTQWRNERSIQLFLVLWFALPFVIFCLAQSRLPLYLLPLFLPLALFTASRMERTFDVGSPRTIGLLATWLVLLLATKAVAAYGFKTGVDNRHAAKQIAATMGAADYRALVFLEEATDTYAVEEQTLWGLRFYLNRPVYGIWWHSPDASTQLCSAIKAQETSLLLVDHDIPAANAQALLNSCGASVASAGNWRNNMLFLVHGVPK
ncbi:ArnT family glycosyltransferase [Dyella japonica]|uniref:ArnT family glycosyltransferase n=1 Tax=Dyella japonica TaxID=231455 RepID=UPI00069A8FFC|nr:glycosyltransferase family 39 protein [Dyella japonica]